MILIVIRARSNWRWLAGWRGRFPDSAADQIGN
jgi:hypothetical protein